jgi:non-canonical poly(A) RNA polymerase PAPD5/7
LQGETKSEPKFASLSALSDSEEVDMDTSDSEDEERPRKKRALGLDGLGDDITRPTPPPTVPKWSNPDPYTSLPPPDESKTPKIDFVKLIRKARLDNAAKSEKSDAVTNNQDFISLGMANESEPLQDHAPEGAPRGPKAMEGLDPSIASRKRTRDDELKGYSRKSGKPASRFNFDGSVVDQWRPLSNEPGTPWLEIPGHPETVNVGTQYVLILFCSPSHY